MSGGRHGWILQKQKENQRDLNGLVNIICKETNGMEIDVNTVIQKLANQIADLQLQVAILQTEKEALQRQLSEKQKENQNKNA